MDSVPSLGLMHSQFTTSPCLSIYEPERADGWRSMCSSANPTMDSVSEEMTGLDDKLEDNTLQTLLTSDMIHSLQSSSVPIVSEYHWDAKHDPTIQQMNHSTDSLGSNPTLAQLNMEPDMSIVEDILNMDSDENSTFDMLCNGGTNSPLTICSSVPPDFTYTKSLASTPTSSMTFTTTKVTPLSSIKNNQDHIDMVSNYLKSSRDNFPPRGDQKPPIGIVAPVKKEEETFPIDNIKREKELGKLEALSPHLRKLLVNKQVSKLIKSEPSLTGPAGVSHRELLVSYRELPVSHRQLLVSHRELPAQIVPLSSAMSTTTKLSDPIKSEPLSPEMAPMKRWLRKEESTEEKWKDIEHFILNPSPEPPTKKRRRNDSGGSALISDDDEDNDDDDDRSIYEGKDYDDDSDDDYSDIDSDLTHISPTECESLVKKQKQYFWQYNVQSKGPKGTRLKLAVDSQTDPHVLNDFEDPVFDECNTTVAGIRHGGKARKGDGNEITPSPKKLFMIGHQLLRLNQQINSFHLGPDVPVAKRNQSKKEKNKLASRACRLKKKAQHEANKIKLFGLEREHTQLNRVLRFMWPNIRDRAKTLKGKTGKTSTESEPISTKLEKRMKEILDSKVGGNMTDFVNSVILQVEAGDNSGGLSLKRSSKT